MRLLLDTHIFIWCLTDATRLTPYARNLISNSDEVYVSSASLWEAMIKISIGKLNVDPNLLVNAIEESGFVELPVFARHTSKLLDLPDIHKDPFDRILLAQAITEPLRFLTSDKLLSGYSELVEVV